MDYMEVFIAVNGIFLGGRGGVFSFLLFIGYDWYQHPVRKINQNRRNNLCDKNKNSRNSLIVTENTWCDFDIFPFYKYRLASSCNSICTCYLLFSNGSD
jgi:hypothetical protein